ncbi:hypothetical protein ACFQ46_10700 [Kineococcus sp. GCM10028916]|uniref:hypothetical protein n=1 Tax=Kineococcus sp. GCM10028916 TaxID=3273394 RepID=UPI00363562CE
MLETAATIGVGVVLGIGFLGMAAFPVVSDGARSRRGRELELRVGRDHLEPFTVRRSRGRFRWESTDVPVSRPVPDGCAPSWRVPHTETVGAELLRSAKGEHWSEVERYVFALTFADGSSLHLDLETGRGDSAGQLVRRRAGLPGSWSEPRPAETAG